jgi:hypothetical protein
MSQEAPRRSVLNLPQVRKLLSSEHFSVDGTLIEALASMKSFVLKDSDGEPAAVGATPSAISMASLRFCLWLPFPSRGKKRYWNFRDCRTTEM